MKKIVWIAVCLVALASAAVVALEVPPLKGKRFHNNSATLQLSDSQVREIEEKLAAMERGLGGMQMAVLIIDSLEGDSIENFSLKVAETWKLGQKRKADGSGDNGLLLTVAVQDRKYRFEVGYGLESILPDSALGTIGRGVLVPNFREGRFIEGIDEAIDLIAKTIKGDFEPSSLSAGRYKKVKKNLWEKIKNDTPDEVPLTNEELADPNYVPSSEDTDYEGLVPLLVMLVVAAGFSIFHFLAGGAVGTIEGAVFSWLYIGHGMTDLLLYAVIGFFVGMVSKHLLRIGLELGISGAFGGGGGGSGGGGASGSW